MRKVVVKFNPKHRPLLQRDGSLELLVPDGTPEARILLSIIEVEDYEDPSGLLHRRDPLKVYFTHDNRLPT